MDEKRHVWTHPEYGDSVVWWESAWGSVQVSRDVMEWLLEGRGYVPETEED